MLLSANMIRLHDVFGMKETFELFSRVGIEGMDFNNDVPQYRSDAHGEDFYRQLAAHAAQCGITICQAHAPFPSSFPEADRSENRFDEIVLAMRNASYLGAPMIVVHPCTHLDYSAEGNAELLFDYNLDFYRRLIPYAREYGIKIAIENIGRVSVTSTPERLSKLYDTLNDPVFTVCFDVGHCLLEQVDPAEAITALGHRLVNGCTHIHDNGGDTDAHTLPFYGRVDWESVMRALAEIGYAGDLNYEASGFIKDLPHALYEDGLAFMARVGHYLISRFEHYRNVEK